MKQSMITELVKFKALETISDEQLISTAGLNVNGFHKKQDGFIDAELVKHVEDKEWCLIFHYESLEKLMKAGDKMLKSREFGELIPLLVPQSIHATFYDHLRMWQ